MRNVRNIQEQDVKRNTEKAERRWIRKRSRRGMANEAEEGVGGTRRRMRGVDGSMERLGGYVSSDVEDA